MARTGMHKSGISRAEQNRAIRRQALLEQLEANGHYHYSLEILKKIEDLDVTSEFFDREFKKLSKAFDGHKAYLDKYLPTPKDIEVIDQTIEHNYPNGIPIELVAVDGTYQHEPDTTTE